jgi:pimeloyl-ACP methyl ester carboxylesterase
MFSTLRYRRFTYVALLALTVALITSCGPGSTSNPTPTATEGTPVPAVKESTPKSSATVSLEGQWEGPIKVAGQELGTIVKFQGSGGTLKAWLDIPAQSVKDTVLEKVSLQGSKLHFEAFGGPRNAVWDGELQTDGTIVGKFTQSTYEGTFTLKRMAMAQATPTAEVPYKQEEVVFKNSTVTLGGTLTTPRSGGPFPVVVLISGSGQQNRDEEIYGFKPFALIADHFTRNGIAVLRYDDRGIGASTGDTANATSADFTGDVAAAVSFLKTRTDINPKQIGLLGHSEGGIIAPMVATSSNDIAYLILFAGPGVPGKAILERQSADILKANGASQAIIDKQLSDLKRSIEVMQTGQGLAEMEADVRAEVRKQIETLPEAQRKALGDTDKAIEDAVQTQMSLVKNPWMKFFVTYDPAPALEKVQVPVLAIFGGKDLQVAAEPNEQAIKAAFARGKNTHATTKTYPEANHLFQPATTGSPAEYANLKTFVPGLLDDTVKWIKDTNNGN